MKSLYAIGSLLILTALAIADTPAPLEVTLSTPVEVTKTVTESTSTAKIEWILITPESAEIRAKIQPQNIEVSAEDIDYAAVINLIETKVRSGKSLREAFSETLQPHVDNAIPR